MLNEQLCLCVFVCITYIGGETKWGFAPPNLFLAPLKIYTHIRTVENKRHERFTKRNTLTISHLNEIAYSSPHFLKIPTLQLYIHDLKLYVYFSK